MAIVADHDADLVRAGRASRGRQIAARNAGGDGTRQTAGELVLTDELAIDPKLQRFMAQRAGSTTVQFDDASHVGGLTHYFARFTKLIEDAAETTQS